MNILNKYAGVIALVALIIAGVVSMGGSENIFGANQCASGQTCLPSLELTGPNSGVTNALQIDSGTFALGSSGTGITQIITGSGALIYTSSSVTASTTKAMDIAVTGVVSTDKVFVQSATTTANGLGWAIVGANASTTSGYITVQVANMSGATGNVPASIASSTPYLIIR